MPQQDKSLARDTGFPPRTCTLAGGLPAGRAEALTPMWMERKEGDFLYRSLKAFSEGGSCSSCISFSKVSHLVALDTTALPLKTLPSASLTPTAFAA